MWVLERRGLALLTPQVCRLMLLGSFALLVLVLVPGFGVVVNGARRWFAVAPIVIAVGPAILLIVVEPDLGTALVVAFTVAALMIAAGMPMRYLGRLAA